MLSACGGFIPPNQALNMNGIRGVLAGVTNERFIPRLRLATLGPFVCSARLSPHRDGLEQAGHGGRRGEMTELDGPEGYNFSCSSPVFHFLLPPRGTEGSDLLVWDNMQRGRAKGLQKPELETTRKEDLYIKEVEESGLRERWLGPRWTKKEA